MPAFDFTSIINLKRTAKLRFFRDQSRHLKCKFEEPTNGPRNKRSYFSIGKHYVQIRGQNGGGGVVYATSKVIQAKSIRRTE
ncbi:hypothetical protein J6590_095905, partial [Homalodisca vitripennis]